jgi:sialic acid synthase SpsE/quercetin dioxygenase-like cupin family protein
MKYEFDDLFIFEMANNHQGILDHGLTIIKMMGKISRKHSIKAGIKFQYRDLDTFIHQDYRSREDVKHIPRFLSTRLSDSEYQILIDAVRKENMVPVCTPFDEISVHKCVDHGIEVLKVASCSALDWPLLNAISDTKKPVIISTGGLTIYDIDKIVSFCAHKEMDHALMHCVGLYPTPSDKIYMNFMSKMIRRYPYVSIGYSGHEDPENFDVVKIAVTKGAKVFERHVGVPTDKIKLNAYSMNPDQVDKWIEHAMIARNICGNNEEKMITQDEIDSLSSLKRGVYAANKVEKGQFVEEKDVYFAMPCVENQLTSGEFCQYRTTISASEDYKTNSPLFEHSQPDIYSLTRNIIHDAKGMLYEANIELGNDITIELSHQYGLEHIRQTGAIIVNVINREYCKKIIIMLPTQKHPGHHHVKKEETFQLLWGDLEVNLNGDIFKLKPGEKLLVSRNDMHSFNTIQGAIFEEISTTSLKDDSYYEDENINQLDPIQRKTFIENW